VLERFLSAGTPPFYVGFGSQMDPDGARTVAMIREAARMKGYRAVIPAEWAGVEPGSSPDTDFLLIRHIPHTALFHRTSGVIHHGGAGTTFTAAMAGVPQTAIPHAMDQYHTADRLFQMGIGPAPVRKKLLTVQYLAKTMEAMVQNPRYKENALELKKKLSLRDGVEEIVNLVLGKLSAVANSPPSHYTSPYDRTAI
jgi:sterol 3beta-glucosyltransferase